MFRPRFLPIWYKVIPRQIQPIVPSKVFTRLYIIRVWMRPCNPNDRFRFYLASGFFHGFTSFLRLRGYNLQNPANTLPYLRLAWGYCIRTTCRSGNHAALYEAPCVRGWIFAPEPNGLSLVDCLRVSNYIGSSFEVVRG